MNTEHLSALESRDPAARESALLAALPAQVRARVTLVPDWIDPSVHFDAVLHHGSAQALREISRRVAERAGPIVAVIGLQAGEVAVPLERLIVERAVSVNTAAAGGNASLMTLD